MYKEIKAIHFGTFNTEDIVSFSVVEVQNTDTYAGDCAKTGGIFDQRMGICFSNKKCDTCGKDLVHCTGHFGHIHLDSSCINPNYYDKIQRLLSMICVYCNRIKMLDEEMVYYKKINIKSRFGILYNDLKCKCCPFYEDCGRESVKYTRQGLKMVMETNDNMIELKPDKIYDIFNKLSERDLYILGFDFHPKNWIWKKFPICPPIIRPSIRGNSDLRSEDDLSSKISDIIKTNNNLLIENDIQKKEELHLMLQYHISTYVNNEISGINPSQQITSNRILKTLVQRLKGKEGRVRGNLMGKRVDFSSRSPITPDPNLRLDELGVPLSIAMTITFPEILHNYNYLKIKRLIENGPDVYPGANYIRKKSGELHDLRFAKKCIENGSIKLEIGDTIERHLMNGDNVLFNRQPSLHKMSMMSHKVHILPGDSFRLNLSATTPYNADFDGDEMNMHGPQNIQTSIELLELSNVSTQIISPQNSKPVIGIVQDACLGSYLLTQPGVYIYEYQFFDILCIINYNRTIPKPDYPKIKGYSGKTVIECLLPENFNYKMGNILIKNGKFIKGELTKKNALGNIINGIIHKLYLMYSKEICSDFISNLQFVINKFLTYRGFSIGFKDCLISSENHAIIKNIINEQLQCVENVKEEYKQGLIDYNKLEEKTNYYLNIARDKAGDYANKSVIDNSINEMVDSGSKGSFINISQIIATVGQQNVAGKRIENQMEDRALVLFEKGDIGAEAHGFIVNSYLKGLNASEFFFACMAGREGSIDTSVKTSDTGYSERKMIKSMEDLKINYDYTVRDNIGHIVQFKYGDDMLDGHKVHTLKLKYNKEIEHELKQYNIDFDFTFSSPIDPISLLLKYKQTQNDYIIYKGYYQKHMNHLIQKYKLKSYEFIFRSYFTYDELKMCSIESFDMLFEKIYKFTEKSLCPPGEMVGIIGAQSIGEPITQLTLNTFHLSGVSSAAKVTQGLPRLKELFSTTKNQKLSIMELELIDKESDIYIESSLLEETRLKDICVFELFKDSIGDNEYCEYKLSCKFDNLKLYIKNINLIDIYIEMRKLIRDKNVYITMLSENTLTPCISLYLDKNIELEDNEYFDKYYLYFRELKKNLSEIIVSGLSCITNTFIEKDKIITEGANFSDLISLTKTGIINIYTAYINDIREVERVFGIEAVRESLIYELRKTFEDQGSFINYRHLALLVDQMTYYGIVLSIDRNGINQYDIGPLARATFEETNKQFVNAATFGEIDYLTSVKSNIMLGKIGNYGTGSFDIYSINENKNNYDIKYKETTIHKKLKGNVKIHKKGDTKIIIKNLK
jgi:DNA-directed RNA polymerase beta' subunit